MAKNSLPRPLQVPVADAHSGLRDVIRRTDPKNPRHQDLGDSSNTPPTNAQHYAYDVTTGLMIPVDPPDIIFDYPGAFAVVTSARIYPKNTLRIIGLAASLGTAGSSNTTVAVLKNGVSIGSVTLGSGVNYNNTTISATTLTGRTDYYQIQVSAVGTGALDLGGGIELG